VLVLALRGFAPGWMKSLLRTRLDRYEMRDADRDSTQYDVPIVSGAFMLFRSGALKQIAGFRRDYFLYFEDFDLSLRMAKIARVAYVPAVCIRHHGGYAAEKGWRHLVLFVRGGAIFFRRHGWRWL
jgi:GT2 family glycosyltransferase